MHFTLLSKIFGLYKTTASDFFFSVLKTLSPIARKWTWWQPKWRVQATMPDCFKLHFPNTRVIIDCSEIKIQSPSGVAASILTYSSYKGGFTAKFLIGCAPSGIITYLSHVYGGRATDTHITSESKLIDLLEVGDEVQADKGMAFTEDSLPKFNFCFLPFFRVPLHLSRCPKPWSLCCPSTF